ncbi:MAG: hypothetical protein JF564_00090 [Sphingomonas sp.]|nr:hypothetical protein [Sphingomonas sp.]
MAWHVTLFNMMLAISCGYALKLGGPPERIVGGSLLIAALATALSFSPIASRFLNVEIGVLLTDLVLLVTLVVVAIHADRGWTLVLAGLQLDTVGAHFVKAINPQLLTVTYALMIAGWSYPMVILLAIGTHRHRRRLRARGYDPSWRLQDISPDASPS